MRKAYLLVGWGVALALAACAAPVPSPTATASSTASPVPPSSVAPSSSVAPTPTPATATTRTCSRVPEPTCAQVVEMVRRFRPAAFTPDTTAVVGPECPPGSFCRLGFGVIVVLVRPGWAKVADLPAFTVLGLEGPERVVEWPNQPLPHHIVALLPERVATP